MGGRPRRSHDEASRKDYPCSNDEEPSYIHGARVPSQTTVQASGMPMGSSTSLLGSCNRTVWLVNVNLLRVSAAENTTRCFRFLGRSVSDEQVLARFHRTLIFQSCAF